MPATLWAAKDAVHMLVLSAATAATVVAGPSDDWVQLLLWGPLGSAVLSPAPRSCGRCAPTPGIGDTERYGPNEKLTPIRTDAPPIEKRSLSVVRRLSSRPGGRRTVRVISPRSWT